MTADPRPSSPPAADGPAPAYGHDNNFDLMRFVLAVLVILSHCYAATAGDGDAHEPVYRLTAGRVSTGGLAVDGFFVISGFLITASWERSRSGGSYLRKRVLRIYPAFIAATVVCGGVLGPIAAHRVGPLRSPSTVVGLVKAAATFGEPRYPDAFAANPVAGAINSPVWTIRWEFACYLMVAGLGVTRLLRLRTGVLVGLVAVTACYAAEVPLRMPAFVGGPGYVARHWARLPAFYLVGVVLYLYQDRVAIDYRLAVIGAAAVGGGLLYLPMLTPALVLAGGYLLIWFAHQRLVRWPMFARRGDYSYGIYLYGFPIQQCVVAMTGNRLSPLCLFVVATPLAVAAGWASWNGVEKWFVRGRANRTATVPSAGQPAS